jgi:uncharacterized protein
MRFIAIMIVVLAGACGGSARAELTAKDIFKISPYIEAAEAIDVGDATALEKIIRQPGFDVNHETPEIYYKPGRDTFTLLTWAVLGEDIWAVKMLLAAGADPNKGTQATTPLITAARRQSNELFELLLRHGANPNQIAHEGVALTVTLERISLGKVGWDRAELLLKHGADVNIDFDQGTTPIIDATVQHWYPGVLWLLEHGANYEARDNTGETMLCWLRFSYQSGALKPSELYNARDRVRDWLLAHGVARSRVDPALHPGEGCDD